MSTTDLPASVRIGPLVFSVEIVDRLQDNEQKSLDGHITYGDCTIRINSRLCPQMRHQVLWHEVIHGILSVSGLELEEEKVDILAYGLMRFRQDNPEL